MPAQLTIGNGSGRVGGSVRLGAVWEAPVGLSGVAEEARGCQVLDGVRSTVRHRQDVIDHQLYVGCLSSAVDTPEPVASQDREPYARSHARPRGMLSTQLRVARTGFADRSIAVSEFGRVQFDHRFDSGDRGFLAATPPSNASTIGQDDPSPPFARRRRLVDRPGAVVPLPQIVANRFTKLGSSARL